ncbi:MAG TPA: PDGLE domain-containing protein [Armatimonadota bacterium]|nr:PDGLE domain-containing protein [Armatimonadota bacterium]
MKTATKLWIGLIALVILSPLGLILPAKLGTGSAWGEWSADEIHKMVGYVPSGMSRVSEFWKAPLPDYAFRGQENPSLRALSLSYVVSGILGAAAVAVLTILIGRTLVRREHSDAP